MAGGEVFETPLREQNSYLPVLGDIPSDVARRAKLLYVCYPNNPTGAVATREFYEDAVRFCREFERASTTAVNAYVGPLMEAYLG